MLRKDRPMAAAFLLLLLSACSSPATDEQSAVDPASVRFPPGRAAVLEVSNPSTNARPDTTLSFGLNELGVTGPVHAVGEISQLIDDDADGAPDRLVILTDLAPAQSKSITIEEGAPESAAPIRTQAELSVKTGGEWRDNIYLGGKFENVSFAENPAPQVDHQEYFRYEGPGIESDKIGYRVYLDHRNGFDIFGKEVNDLVLQNVGLDGYDSYHEMSDWGADILKVGDSLGTGGFGYWNGDAVETVSNVSGLSARILSSGPIQSSFRLDYKNWKSTAGAVDVSATLSMAAGSPFVDVSLKTSDALDNIAIGLVKHPGTELIKGNMDIAGEAWTYMASFGRQTEFDDNLGMVVLFRRADFVKYAEDANNYAIVMRPHGTELHYAFGAFWEKGVDGVTTSAALEDRLKEEVLRRTVPPRIRLKTANSEKLGAMSGDEISLRLAQSELERRGDGLVYGEWDNGRRAPAAWTYSTGLLLEALDDVATTTGDAVFSDYAKRVMDSFVSADGDIADYDPEEFNIDSINPGKMLQRLYERTGEPRYKLAISRLAAQLDDQPRTSEGAFWHKKRYPHQLWLDGVYMGMPFLARVGASVGDASKLEAAVHEFEIARAHLRDSSTGLYFHAWDEAGKQVWADPVTGRSPHVWARGMGWYAMALVDTLEAIPPEDKDLRKRLIDLSRELAATLAAYQNETGVWFQIMDMPLAPGNYREASASAMFAYFLAKGVNDGVLDDKYADIATRAYAGIVSEFLTQDADGRLRLNNICQTAGLGFGRDGGYEYYMSEPVVSNDPKGVGPMMMAGLQVAQLRSMNHGRRSADQ